MEKKLMQAKCQLNVFFADQTPTVHVFQFEFDCFEESSVYIYIYIKEKMVI